MFQEADGIRGFRAFLLVPLRNPHSAIQMWDWLSTVDAPTWLEAAPKAAFVAWIGYVGACIGSFLNVVYHRVPRGEDIVVRGSHCPVCDHAIRWRHNLPIFGWLILRGKCYDCGARIPIRYWLFELFFGAMFALVGWWFWSA